MKIFSNCGVLSLMLTLCLASASFGAGDGQPGEQSLTILADASAAQTAQETPKVSDDSWISNGKALGPWWRKNAKRYDPLPRPLLYHVKGVYSFSELGGNVEAKTHRGSVELTLRKHIVTSITSYTISKKNTEIKLTEKSTDLDNQSFRQAFRIALTDNMSAAAGMIWERNETKYLKDRFVYYGGLRYMIAKTENFDLMVGGFYSLTETSYLSENIQGVQKYSDFPSQEDYDSDSVYFTQKLNWDITDKISFSERADYMTFLEDSDYYLWKLRLSLSFKLTKSVSFVTSYSVNYDMNSFVDAVQDYLDARRAEGMSAGEMETTDTALSVGIKFEF